MSSEVKITAGIVLFNPNIRRLEENIKAVAPQVTSVFLIDNHSDNLNEIEKLVSAFQGVYLIENTQNQGIAYALNQIIKYSESESATWVLTLDQDSVVPSNLMSEYKKYLSLTNVGLLSCIIEDRNVGTLGKANNAHEKYSVLEQCITSATLMNLKVAKEVGGFDNNLFIDSVDHDFCIKVRKAGYSIYRINSVHLLHEVGHSKIVNFLGKENLIYNHSAFRHYYIVRNKLILGRKYNKKWYYLRKAIKHILLVSFFETSKTKKIIAMLQGFFDGIFFKIS